MALRSGTLVRSAQRLTHVRPGWLVLAAAAEGGSMLAFGMLQQRLLAAGGSRLRIRSMVAITFATNSVTGTLPGGVAWAAAWLYDQLGSRGVTRFLRVWAFLVAGGVSSFALFLVITAGVELAGTRGPLASLRWLLFLLALIPVVTLLLEVFRNRRPVARMVAWAENSLEREVPGGPTLLGAARSFLARFTAVGLGPRCWAEVLGLALANWLFDCVVVLASFEALGVRVPWNSLLVIYGITQISASIPITPGGVGVVAGSMVALMTAYGVSTAGALSVVLLYRILSFWILVPIGWAVWAALEAGAHRRRLATDGAGAVGDGRAPGPVLSPVPAMQRVASRRWKRPGSGP